ncbi:hypothetical protein OUZ56_012968 [Daphnia magna]|uniref:Uncharacterized protein n=1 Tax=Daphnia magna TaxID=35525 RepID=A0ABQ9Z4J5_9CRUS|nr:hypothetical protein OUZ56_012968 [Daphnia magna]
MPFFTVLLCFFHQWRTISPRNAESAVAESAPVVVTSAAFGMEDQSEDLIDLSAGNQELECVVEQVPKPERDCGIRKECNEGALKEPDGREGDELAEIIDSMKLEAMEASTAREELARQNLKLQNELLRKECDLQTIEQEMKEVIFSIEKIRNLKINQNNYEERISCLEKELADKESQRQLEHADQHAEMEHAMAHHARQLNDIESENKVFVQRKVKQHQLDMDEQRVQYESATAELRKRLENEHQARLHSALEKA